MTIIPILAVALVLLCGVVTHYFTRQPPPAKTWPIRWERPSITVIDVTPRPPIVGIVEWTTYHYLNQASPPPP